MGSSGIRFSDYGSVPVERSGPGAQDPPPLPEDAFQNAQTMVPALLAANLARCGYSTPTPIQRHAIPLGLAGQDLMCVAQTGSGKTCGFLLPSMSALLTDARGTRPPVRADTPASPRAVVMAPTRELASQIHLESKRLGYVTSLRTCVVYGGADARAQLAELARGVDVCVATPGRLIDFIDRRVISLACSRVLVLDEADRMLDMGFEPQIRRIVNGRDMPAREAGRQTLMFSATFAPEVQKLARDFLREYTYVVVGRVGSTVNAITQRLMFCPANDKRAKMQLLFEAMAAAPPPARTLVFVQKKRTAAWVAKELSKVGVPAESIHGDRTQSQRESALAAFKSGARPVLVATDVAARGIDVSGVAHVVNFDLPTAADDFDSYVHRIGRTGRAGHTGLATSFFVPGNDPKHGNGRIAPLLLELLAESKQEVPPWLPGECGGMRAGAIASKRAPTRDVRANFGETMQRFDVSTREQPQEPQQRHQQQPSQQKQLPQKQQKQKQQKQQRQQKPAVAAPGAPEGASSEGRSGRNSGGGPKRGRGGASGGAPAPPGKTTRSAPAPMVAKQPAASADGNSSTNAPGTGGEGKKRRRRGRGSGGGANGGTAPRPKS